MWSDLLLTFPLYVGDMSLFPNSTNLVFGPGTNRVIYPDDPNGVLQASDFA